MPWSAGTFSRANGSTGWQDDQAANIGIEAGRHDTQDNDFRNGINETINKAGQNTPTANLPMGGFKHTGVANAAASSEYTAYGQVQAGVNVQSTALDWTATQYSNDTTAAKFVLQKSRGATTGSNVIVNNGDSIGSLEFRGNNGTTFTNAASIAAAVDAAPGATNDMPGRLVFSTSADASGTPTERMRITSTGNVRVTNVSGTDAFFQTSGQVTAVSGLSNKAAYFAVGATNTSDAGVVLGSLTGNTPYIAASKMSDGTATDLRFYTNDAERMRLDSNGNFGINETNPATFARFVSTTTANTFSAAFLRSNASGDVGQPTLQIRKFDNNSTTSQIFAQFEINNTNTGSGRISANGASQAAFATYSDATLKENIVDLPSQYDALKNLRPVEFDYIDGSGHQIGFIAQEVQNIYPDLVGVDKQTGKLTLTGLGRNEARLIKAFQELAETVEVLEARIAALEGA
jgi:hypothetical protein